MNRSAWTRYGWVLVLLALGGLWLRIENQPLHNTAIAAPSDVPLPPLTIAVIDMAVIFKNFGAFNQEMLRIKHSIEEFDSQVKRDTQDLKILGDRMNLHPDTSDEYKRLREEIVAKVSDLQARVTRKKAEVLDREVIVYYDSYQKVEAAAKVVAQQRKANLVLRFTPEFMKRDNRESVMQAVNRPFVFRAPETDVTDDVLAVLNQP